MGFMKTKEDKSGSVWEYEIKDYKPKSNVITIKG